MISICNYNSHQSNFSFLHHIKPFFHYSSRSHHPLKLNHWHTVKVSRTGLLAEIQVDRQRRVSHIGAGAFTQVSTSDYNVYIGGVPTFEIVSPFIPVKTSYEGCIQKVNHLLSI